MSTILLVEDNPHIMKINHTSLMMEGYDILEATTIAECRAALKSHDVDLIVLDIMLPDGNGVELCSELKHRYEIPILFLSALGENKDIIAALRAGGDDYLPKPFHTAELLARIRSVLRRGRSGGDLSLSLGNVSLWPEGRRVEVEGRELALLKKVATRCCCPPES